MPMNSPSAAITLLDTAMVVDAARYKKNAEIPKDVSIQSLECATLTPYFSLSAAIESWPPRGRAKLLT